MLYWHGEKFLADLEAAIDDRGREIAEILEGTAKAHCPVRTGRLQASIYATTNYVGKGLLEVKVGSDVEYAPYVELGTDRMAAQPFLEPALTENTSEIINILSRKID
jgi:HK97 gp10 family phage protein